MPSSEQWKTSTQSRSACRTVCSSLVSENKGLVALFSFFPQMFIYLGCAASQLQLRMFVAAMWACQLQHTCRIKFPNQGSNPGPLHWGGEILSTGPPGNSLSNSFLPFLPSQRKPWSSVPKIVQQISLVVQQIGICLPVQGTQVQSLAWRESTYQG